jgi:hypothetical protein
MLRLGSRRCRLRICEYKLDFGGELITKHPSKRGDLIATDVPILAIVPPWRMFMRFGTRGQQREEYDEEIEVLCVLSGFPVQN